MTHASDAVTVPWKPVTDALSAGVPARALGQQDATAQAADQDATALPDSADGVQQTAYDSVWASTSIPVQESSGIEAQLLKEDKLYAVLAVVLIIWLGIAFFILRTDRKLDQLERQVDNKS